MKTILAIWASIGSRHFWRDYPKKDIAKKAGPWVAVAIRCSPFHSKEVDRVLMPEATLEMAYLKARRLARSLDFWTPVDRDGEIGINWAVRRPFPDEVFA